MCFYRIKMVERTIDKQLRKNRSNKLQNLTDNSDGN